MTITETICQNENVFFILIYEEGYCVVKKKIIMAMCIVGVMNNV